MFGLPPQHPPQDAREALRWFFYYCIENEITRPKAAELVKSDQSTLFRVYTGTYTDPKGRSILPAKLVKNIQSFRRIEEKRSSLGDVPFVATPTAKKIWQICDLVTASNRVGFIWGDSQTGKTTALLEYKRRHNHGATKYIRVEPSSGTHEIIRQVARECALSERANHDALKHRVIRAIDRNTLLIVDEIHELSFTYRHRSKLSCFELLRWIHDQSHCGMIICGTNIGRDDLKIGKDKDLLDQFTRRGIFSVQLGAQPTPADLKAIFKQAFDLEYPSGEPLELIKAVNQHQGLTAVTEYLRFATRLAKKADQPLRWEHFCKAHKIITGLAA